MFVESLEEAVRDAVNALKGPKAVGVLLWPSMKADLAGRRVCQCLDPERDEKFDLSEVLLIAKLARQQNCHTLMAFLAQELDYEWKPVDPETEQQRLMRDFISAQKALSDIAARIEKRQAENPNLRRVA
jgi:hypothetical protein